MVKRGEMMDVEDIVDLLSIDLIGVVPDDEYIITYTNKGEPVISNKKRLLVRHIEKLQKSIRRANRNNSS